MVDISVQILFNSLPISKEGLRFKLKTWWAHVDVEEGVNFIKLPSLPMIENYYNLSGKETIIFVEAWYRNEQLYPPESMRFLGLAKCSVDDLLKHPEQNPSVEWLEVYDPIENICRGRVLLKVDAKFSPIPLSELNPPAEGELIPMKSNVPSRPSSYFVGHKRATSLGTNTNGSSGASVTTSVESSPRKISVPVQTDLPPSEGCPPVGPSLSDANYKIKNSKTSRSSQPPQKEEPASLKSNSKSKMQRYSLEMEKTRKEKDNERKKVVEKVLRPQQQPQQPFEMTVAGKTYTIQLGKSGPKVTSKNAQPSSSTTKNQRRRSETATSGQQVLNKKISTINEDEGGSSDSSVDEVINLLNENLDKIVINNNAKSEGQSVQQPQYHNVREHSRPNNNNLLRLQDQDRRVQTESDYDSSFSPLRFNPNARVEPDEGLNDTNSSNFSPIISPRDELLDSERGKSPTVNIQPVVPSSVNCTQGQQDPGRTQNNNGRPPRSRRIAAAIFNDAFI